MMKTISRLLNPLMLLVALLAIPAIAVAQKALVVNAQTPSIASQILDAAMPQIVTVVVGLIGLIAIVIQVGGKALIQAHVQSALLRSALLWLNEVVGSVVTKVEQTAAADLRERAQKGEITADVLKQELEKLKSTAIAEVSALTFGRLLGAGLSNADATSLIDTTIEAAVPTAKATVAASRALPTSTGADPLRPSAAG